MGKPTPNTITMWDKRGDQSIEITPDAVDQATANGWFRQKPSPQPKQAAAPAKPAYDPITQTGFGRGVKKGLNPFHSAPEGLPSRGHDIIPDKGMATHLAGGAVDVAEDMFNIRETKEMWNKGNKSGAIGLGIGSTAALVGPELLKMGSKALKGSGILDKALSAAGKSEAIKRAMSTTGKTIGKTRAIAEQLIQPIHEALNARFEPMHKALEKQIIPLSAEAQRLVKGIAELEPEMEKHVSGLIKETGETVSKAIGKSAETAKKTKLGGGVTKTVKSGQKAIDTTKEVKRMVRTALDYREADKLVSKLKSIAGGSDRVTRLAGEIDKEIDTIAKAAGLEKERSQLKGLWKEMHDVRNVAWESVKEKGLARQLVKAISHQAGSVLGEGERQASKEAIELADKLFAKVTGEKAGALRKAVGKAGIAGSKVWRTLPPAWKAINSMFTESAPPQSGGGV